ncbi:hypothetical protein EAF00_004381 [Botryotinia globosa]|nr:hypothetical protein EAF00_004381 [Botryotinia globosa]
MDDYEDSEEVDLGLPDESDDHSTLKPSQQRLGLSSKYVRDWTKSNAFRKFCQNWNDAMSKTSGVSRDKLRYVHIKVANGILGFLAFDKKRGMVELCNYNSQLAREVLDMGGTSKADDDEMAGTHGEGSKLAALLMIREGHQFYWNFCWGTKEKKKLWCFLSEVKKKPTQQELNPRTTQSPVFREASP